MSLTPKEIIWSLHQSSKSFEIMRSCIVTAYPRRKTYSDLDIKDVITKVERSISKYLADNIDLKSIVCIIEIKHNISNLRIEHIEKLIAVKNTTKRLRIQKNSKWKNLLTLYSPRTAVLLGIAERSLKGFKFVGCDSKTIELTKDSKPTTLGYILADLYRLQLQGKIGSLKKW